MAKSPPSGSQQFTDVCHYVIEPLSFLARPSHAEQTVEMLIPGPVHLELRQFLPPISPLVQLSNFPRQSSADPYRINSERAHQTHYQTHHLSQARLT